MYGKIAVAAGLVATAFAAPQGVTQDIPAPGAPAPGCSMDSPNSFQITTINATTSPSTQRVKRQQNPNDVPGGPLILTLMNGQLHNQQGDTGYVAANYQFQFDSPPQTGAIYTGGFSLCGNGSLAHGASTIFYSCNSGGFNNLYDRNWAPQCSPVYINAIIGGAASSSAGGASQTTDGQAQAPTSAGVSQVSDNQPQATTAAAGVTQISDNQPQAMTSAAGISQISDNQPQAMTSAAAVTQISDNQPQAMTSAAAPAITQISDNQPQAPTSAVISQIGDNQPQAPATAATPMMTPTAASTPAAYTGAAVKNGLSNFALAGAAALGVAML